MCGLAFAATKNKQRKTGQRVWHLFDKQRSRGTSGFGYIAIDNGEVTALVRGKVESDIKDKLMKETAEIVLLHHRYPTSTENTLGTTHPILVSNDELEYDYLIAHNGVISNDEGLKKKHQCLGYRYTTEFIETTYATYSNGQNEMLGAGKTYFNDSECLAIELARFLEGKSDKVYAEGPAAIIGVQLFKGTKKVREIIYGQNYGRSLGIERKKGFTLIASENGSDVPRMKLFHMNPNTFATTETDLEMGEARKEDKQVGFSADRVRVEDNPYDLVNALYTRQEAIDSGAPMSDFYSSERVRVNGIEVQMYVPAIFTGISPKTRPLFSEAYHYVLENDDEVDESLTDPYYGNKNLERLEDLAMKFGRKKYQLDHLEGVLAQGKIPEHAFRKRKETLDKEMEEIEVEMSTLGFEQSEVEETLDTAQQLVDYEYSARA